MIDFPTTPVVDTVVTSPNGMAWRWDGTAWQIVGASGSVPVVAGAGMTSTGSTLNVIGDATMAVAADSLGVANDGVSNAKLANMPALTIKGNNAGAVADPVDLSGAQVNALIGNTRPGPEIGGLMYNGFNGVAYPPSAGYYPIIETNSTTWVAGNSGWGSFSFSQTFPTPPMVLCMCGDFNAGLVFYNYRACTQTTYAFVAIRYDMTYPPAGTQHRVNYIAISPSA